MPGIDARLLDEFDQRRAVFGLLPDCLVIEDDAGNMLHAFGRAEQHLAIVAAAVFGRLNANGVKALLDSSRRFVCSQDALAGRDHGLCDFVQFIELHSSLHRIHSCPGRGAPQIRDLKICPLAIPGLQRTTSCCAAPGMTAN